MRYYSVEETNAKYEGAFMMNKADDKIDNRWATEKLLAFWEENLD